MRRWPTSDTSDDQSTSEQVGTGVSVRMRRECQTHPSGGPPNFKRHAPSTTCRVRTPSGRRRRTVCGHQRRERHLKVIGPSAARVDDRLRFAATTRLHREESRAVAATTRNVLGRLIPTTSNERRKGGPRRRIDAMLRPAGIASFARPRAVAFGVVRSRSLVVSRPRTLRVVRPTELSAGALLDEVA